MKKKLLVAAITLTTVTSIYAAQGKGYREYGEKIEQSPGANFHLEEMPPGSFGTVVANNKKKILLSVGTRTSVPSRSGRVNQYLQVDGYHDFTITNNTHQRQTYRLFVSLECGSMRFSDSRYVDIEPGGYYTRNDHSYGAVQQAYPGSYRIAAETSLDGESSHSSRDSNTLYVSK